SLGEAGAERVLAATTEAFARYDGAGYAAAVVAAVNATSPALVLFGASSIGKDLAPRVAAKLGVGLAADGTGLERGGGKPGARRPVMAGKAFERVAFPRSPAMATLRPKVFPPAAPEPGKTAAVESLTFAWDASKPRAVVTGTTGAS